VPRRVIRFVLTYYAFVQIPVRCASPNFCCVFVIECRQSLPAATTSSIPPRHDTVEASSRLVTHREGRAGFSFSSLRSSC